MHICDFPSRLFLLGASRNISLKPRTFHSLYKIPSFLSERLEQSTSSIKLYIIRLFFDQRLPHTRFLGGWKCTHADLHAQLQLWFDLIFYFHSFTVCFFLPVWLFCWLFNSCQNFYWFICFVKDYLFENNTTGAGYIGI